MSDYQHLIDSFHLMWDNFPMRARLIHKDRTVLALNKFAQSEGLQTGVKCVHTPPKQGHAGCKANAALRMAAGVYDVSPDQSRLRFWVPVSGSSEVYVHFSILGAAFNTPPTPPALG